MQISLTYKKLELEELKSKQLGDIQSVADTLHKEDISLLIDNSIIIINPAVFFFHPNHASTSLSTGLGSTSTLITDMFGDPYQFFLNLPFGETFAEQRRNGSFNNTYKFNGKELDPETGLYYYGARYYNPRTSVWLSVDPLAEKGPQYSPYNYCFNNPIFYVDPDGRWAGPGDLFGSPQEAATDFGITYNGRSIVQYREYGSTIYKVEKGGKVYYTYTEAAKGTNDGVVPSKNPEGTEAVAYVHSHGGYEERYDNNNFSGDGTIEGGGDKAYAIYYNIDGYVTTPDGSVKEYNHKTNKVKVLNTNQIPSDPNDPERKNNIHPTQDHMIQESVRKINEAGGVLKDPDF